MDSLLDKVSTSLWQGAIYFEIFVAILIAGVYFESWYAVLIAFCILVFCFNIQKLKMLLFVLFSLFWCALPFITLQFDEGVPIGIILFSIFLFLFSLGMHIHCFPSPIKNKEDTKLTKTD